MGAVSELPGPATRSEHRRLLCSQVYTFLFIKKIRADVDCCFEPGSQVVSTHRHARAAASGVGAAYHCLRNSHPPFLSCRRAFSAGSET